MSKLKQNKNLLILLITIISLFVLGGTYALYKLLLFDDLNVNVATKGLDYYLNYNKGANFNGELLLCEDYTEGNDLSITLYKKNNRYAHIYGHIYLKINNIGSNLRQSEALKYTVVDSNDNELNTGTLRGVNKNETILLTHDIDLSTTEKEYTVYIWLDKYETIDPTIEGDSFSATLVVEATQKPITAEDFDGREIVSYENMTPVQKISYDIELTADWFENQRNKTLNGETTEEVYDEWIERMGDEFPTCPSSDELDITDCFADDGDDSGNDLYTIGRDIFNVIGLGDKGIQFNSYHTMAFINESTDKICVTFKLGKNHNYYYGIAPTDEFGNDGYFSTEDGYPLIHKSSGCNN